MTLVILNSQGFFVGFFVNVNAKSGLVAYDQGIL
jgi:hypothetical protein